MTRRTYPALSIIGCGRVGQPRGRLWQDPGLFPLQDVQIRSLASARRAVAFMGAAGALTGPAARGDTAVVPGQGCQSLAPPAAR